VTAVKYCGITRVEDAVLAAELGAAAVGLILWEGSPRAVTRDRARSIVLALPPFVASVAVMVSPSIDEVRRAVDETGARVIQLHGPLDLGAFFDSRWTVVRAASMAEGGVRPDEVDARATLLLDAHDPARYGGTGVTIDWAAAARVAASRRMVLAGGLRPDNVGDAIRQVRPYAVDVASGVEASPGVKDQRKMRAFAARVRETDMEGMAKWV
jgi:phosphoribosylanthranilate isomerase